MRMFGQMRRSRACWAALGAAASAVVFLGGTAVAATGWTVVTVPQTGISTVLYGAFARTGTDAWAVGRQFGPSGQPAPPPVAYHWNGSAWSLLTTPALPAAGCCTGTAVQAVPVKFIASAVAPAEVLPMSQISVAETAVMDEAAKPVPGRGTVRHAAPSQ